MSQTISKDLSELIRDLIASVSFMEAKPKVIIADISKHPYPILLVQALRYFKQIGLFYGYLAESNYKRAISLICPTEIAEAMAVFAQTYLPHEFDAQCAEAYFNHIVRHDNTWFTTTCTPADDSFITVSLTYDVRRDWLDIAKAFKCLYNETYLFKGDNARSNVDKLFGFHMSGTTMVLSALQTHTVLLKGPEAQLNFDLLMTHRDRESVIDALLLFVFWTPADSKTSLLGGEMAQANFESLLKKDYLATALPRLLKLTNMGLTALEAQVKFNELMLDVLSPGQSTGATVRFFRPKPRIASGIDPLMDVKTTLSVS